MLQLDKRWKLSHSYTLAGNRQISPGLETAAPALTLCGICDPVKRDHCYRFNLDHPLRVD